MLSIITKSIFLKISLELYLQPETIYLGNGHQHSSVGQYRQGLIESMNENGLHDPLTGNMKTNTYHYP